MDCKIIKYVSYNLHGLNQGLPYLTELLLNNDIICIQEHWLSSEDISKLRTLNDKFIVFGSSAMDKALGQGILRGRQFGGVAIFLADWLAGQVQLISCEERFIVLMFGNTLVINVQILLWVNKFYDVLVFPVYTVYICFIII